MRKLLSVAAGAALLTGVTMSAFAQPTSPVPGSQPGTKSPGADLPKTPSSPGTGSGSAPMGPPATTPTEPSATPGTPSVPGTPSAPGASKKLDTPSAGGGTK